MLQASAREEDLYDPGIDDSKLLIKLCYLVTMLYILNAF